MQVYWGAKSDVPTGPSNTQNKNRMKDSHGRIQSATAATAAATDNLEESSKRGIIKTTSDKHSKSSSGSSHLVPKNHANDRNSDNIRMSMTQKSIHDLMNHNTSMNHNTRNDQTCSKDEEISDCDTWRKDGRERRMQILGEDELNGGSDFQIHYQSPLRTYSAIADRVSNECVYKHG
jgi:hypothetical protein